MRYQFGGVVQIKTNLMTFNSLVSIHSLVSIDCGFLIQLVFCKKKTMWFIGVEVEQETSAPPPKKNPGSAPGRYCCEMLQQIPYP